MEKKNHLLTTNREGILVAMNTTELVVEMRLENSGPYGI